MSEKKKLQKKTLSKYQQALKLSVDALEFMDFQQKKWGWSRQERRQFWRDWISSPKFREEQLGKLKGDFGIG